MTDTGIINIHGKQYHTVAKRVQDFRAKHPDFALTTEVAFRDGNLVAVKASIADEAGRVIATGHAEEDRTKGQINRTSALENAETSAIGRALAAFGIGGTEFASANEVENAIHQQAQPDTAPPTISDDQRIQLINLMEANNYPVADFLSVSKITDLRQLPAAKFEGARKWLHDQIKQKEAA